MAPTITKNTQYRTSRDTLPPCHHLPISGDRNLNQAETPLPGTLAAKRGIIPGFPHPSSSLPKDIDHEAIIKHYPNHLRGKLLLQISATWTPKEISTTSGLPELKANTIVKRIRAAKIAEGHASNKKNSPAAAKRAAAAAAAAAEAEAATQRPGEVNNPITTESSASLKFLQEQLAIQQIMLDMDPEWADRQSGNSKKMPARDRMLVKKATGEYERRMGATVVVVD